MERRIHGALACRALDDFGTLEKGKRADLVLLDTDPLADISNIRKRNRVIEDGKLIDLDRLPETPIYYRQDR